MNHSTVSLRFLKRSTWLPRHNGQRVCTRWSGRRHRAQRGLVHFAADSKWPHLARAEREIRAQHLLGSLIACLPTPPPFRFGDFAPAVQEPCPAAQESASCPRVPGLLHNLAGIRGPSEDRERFERMREMFPGAWHTDYAVERTVAIRPNVTAGRERYARLAAFSSIEARDPFLDRRVVDYLLAIAWPGTNAGRLAQDDPPENDRRPPA